ncbi:MAG: hypothetical protein ACRCW2_06265 [Cellulosilyticaceae bacterium]
MKYDSSIVPNQQLLTNATPAPQFTTGNTGFMNPLVQGIIRVYQNNIPWENRTHTTLLSLGKILGQDYFIHPLTELSHPIPTDTKIVLLASNSTGNPQATLEENLPTAQYYLEDFVSCGGILIADLASNLTTGGYMVPGSIGTVTHMFPDPGDAYKLYLTPESQCTAFVHGPTLTLTPHNISMDSNTVYSAHGNLVDGITIPPCAHILMTAMFGGIKKPVLAYYCLGNGYVILDTLTKEFYGQSVAGYGPTLIITNLIYFAYRMSRQCCCF